MQYNGIIFTLLLPYFLFRLKSATISVLRNAIRASIFLASTRAEMRKLWLLTALPLPVALRVGVGSLGEPVRLRLILELVHSSPDVSIQIVAAFQCRVLQKLLF